MALLRLPQPPAIPLLAIICGAYVLTACATSGTDAPFKITELARLNLEDETLDMLGESAPVNPRDGAPYRTFAIDLKQAQTVHFNVSASFSPSIALFSPDGTLLSLVNDTSSSGQNEIDLISPVPRDGRYLVVVSSSGRGEYGSFRLNAELFDRQNELTIPGNIRTSLINSGQTHPTTGAPMNNFFFKISTPSILEINLSSHHFDTFLSLVDAEDGKVLAENDDAADTLDSRIITSLEPGRYEIWASAWSTDARGQFSLSIQEADLHLSDSFTLGEPYLGLLGGDVQPIQSTGRNGVPLRFQLDEPVALIASMSSEAFDSYLYLMDSRGRIILENDDASGIFTLNSLIAANLEPGEYTLWASSYSPSSGTFQLDTSLGEFTQSGPIELNSTIEGVLTPQAEHSSTRDTNILYYSFEVQEQTGVQIDLRSRDFDAYLLLEDGNGMLIEENDDNEHSLDSQISRVLLPGAYRVGVTCYAGDCLGRFTLQLRETSGGIGIQARR